MKKYTLLIITTALLCLLFLKLIANYSNKFNEVENSYNNSVSANLICGANFAKALTTLDDIDEGGATFLAQQIEDKLNNGIKIGCLSDLNKRVWQVPASIIANSGSIRLKRRLENSLLSLGQDEEYIENKNKKLKTRVIPSDTAVQGKGRISVKVYTINDEKNKEVCKGVLVRLSENYKVGLNAARRTLAWARTDSTGVVVFDRLNVNKSYSVLPIAEGYEYGSSKGTIKGSLAASTNYGIDSLTYQFEQQEHKIRMFDAKTLAQIKEKHILTVRSPKEYERILLQYLILFFVLWWVFYFVWYCRHKSSDSCPIAILMFLTGLCILSMFSINDPLEDTLYGVDMSIGVIVGVLVMVVMQFVDFNKLYQGNAKIGFDIPFECIKWFFKPFKRKVSYLTEILWSEKRSSFIKFTALIGICICLPFLLLDLIKITKLSEYGHLLKKLKSRKGIGYILTALSFEGSGYIFTALLLTALLWTPLGSEVGGMKVNLNFGSIKFQPSEIAKYLIIFSMAAFFSVNKDEIIKADKLLGYKVKMMIGIIIVLGILMVMYLVLGDMGPALVLAFTFIILYSIVKSKVDVENLDEKSQNKKIFTCDLAMLTYGVISFIPCLWIGNTLGDIYMFIFCIGWLVLWIAITCGLRKQLYESAILFNFIISVFLGGTLLSNMPVSSLNEIGERLESRNEMCTNTWGTLPIDGAVADAGENTQVAEGLWGLASGGLWGQGLGNGSPNFIPAFHTDMILESIGEQLGFFGVFVVILLLALLLRKIILLGYKTSHSFALYLCLGTSIVTAVQFIIISLGSTGIIPLTGVTVPFLSYGKVSMILNMAAFGIVLSYNIEDKADVNPTAKKSIGQYNYPVSILSCLFCIIALFICGVFFYYQFFKRNSTLIKPVYVNNSDGAPIVEYNPRIAQLVNKMWAGDIYDRNGILLATSDKSKLADYKSYYDKLGLGCDTLKPEKRYYPFREHLAFMLGKYGSDTYALTSENTGYIAEYRHLNELRGYNNIRKGNDGQPIKVTLTSNDYKPGRFFNKEKYTVDNLQLRDYSALIPYLKAGYNSRRVAQMNARNESFWALGKIKPHDIYLTVDARLQTLLQQGISKYIIENLPNLNKLRVSVVILDAHNGDLLSSAIYPLPDEERLRSENNKVYNDQNKPNTWNAYSDMDLGLMFPSEPGSTAKVLTGLAGFRKYKEEIALKKYYIDKEEIIFHKEPYGRVLTMKEAYRFSSNCYFINLLNDNDLFNELAYVYGEMGISINGKKAYGLQYDSPTSEWLNMVTLPGDNSVAVYNKYIESRVKEKMNKDKPACWSWAWGQNGIDATPLAMSRAISVVANHGNMPKTRFLLSDEIADVPIIDNSDSLNVYLKYTAIKHDSFEWDAIGGKTGTPERATKTRTVKRKFKDGTEEDAVIVLDKGNDGWYICFIDDATIVSKDITTTSPLAIAIRMERLGKGDMSGNAVRLMKSVVKESLKKLEYIK